MNFHIHESIDQTSLRLYCKANHSPDAYSQEADYDALLVLNFESTDVAYVSKWISKVPLTKKDFLGIRDFLVGRGIQKIRFYRNGRIQEMVFPICQERSVQDEQTDIAKQMNKVDIQGEAVKQSQEVRN